VKLRNRRRFPYLFLLLAAVVIALVHMLVPPNQQLRLFVAVIGGFGGFIGFQYSQHLQETQLFKQLFTEFNRRYDAMNEHLEAIRRRPAGAQLKPEEHRKLVDYLNLCAEEYLFYRSGYIDEDVWKTWARGMLYFAQDAEIRGLWEQELQMESYYGFSLSELSA
jgi:hypothetical protein